MYRNVWDPPVFPFWILVAHKLHRAIVFEKVTSYLRCLLWEIRCSFTGWYEGLRVHVLDEIVASNWLPSRKCQMIRSCIGALEYSDLLSFQWRNDTSSFIKSTMILIDSSFFRMGDQLLSVPVKQERVFKTVQIAAGLRDFACHFTGYINSPHPILLIVYQTSHAALHSRQPSS